MNLPADGLQLYGLDQNLSRTELPFPKELELVKSFDSPARSLEAELPCGQAYPEFLYLELKSGDKRLYYGGVDEQTLKVNDEGRFLRLLSRSLGAVLLDNEARPQTYTNIDLQTMFDNHLKPYGFTVLEAQSIPFFNRFPVEKGTSEWEAFYNFYRSSVLGVVYLDEEDRVVCTASPDTGVRHSISSRKPDALHYSSLNCMNSRYAPVTQFIIRDADGAYSYSYDSQWPVAGLCRRRYLIPSEEFSLDQHGGVVEAMFRVRRSMLGKRVFTAVIPGWQDACICDRADLDTELVQHSGLFVYQLRWKLSAAGSSTTFTLIDPQFI